MTDVASNRDPATREPVMRFHQLGRSMLLILAAAETFLLLGGLVGYLATQQVALLIVPVAVGATLMVLFGSLTIELSAERVRCTMGFVPGLLSRSIPIDDIVAVRTVTAHKLNAWGIRKVRNGWLWNTNGFDAVELELRDGSVFQMGADRPEEVVEAVRAVVDVSDGTVADAAAGAATDDATT